MRLPGRLNWINQPIKLSEVAKAVLSHEDERQNIMKENNWNGSWNQFIKIYKGKLPGYL